MLDNLRSRFSDTSVVIVASRPSTIALADEVVFVAEGQVVAHGTHSDLMAKQSAYRELLEAFESDRHEIGRDQGLIAADSGEADR